MFGIGWPEFLLIGVVAVLVIGPNELPHALYQVGKALKKVREMSNSMQKAFDEVTREEELNDIISNSNNIVSDENIQMEMERQAAIEQQLPEIDALDNDHKIDPLDEKQSDDDKK